MACRIDIVEVEVQEQGVEVVAGKVKGKILSFADDVFLHGLAPDTELVDTSIEVGAQHDRLARTQVSDKSLKLPDERGGALDDAVHPHPCSYFIGGAAACRRHGGHISPGLYLVGYYRIVASVKEGYAADFDDVSTCAADISAH